MSERDELLAVLGELAAVERGEIPIPPWMQRMRAKVARDRAERLDDERRLLEERARDRQQRRADAERADAERARQAWDSSVCQPETSDAARYLDGEIAIAVAIEAAAPSSLDTSCISDLTPSPAARGVWRGGDDWTGDVERATAEFRAARADVLRRRAVEGVRAAVSIESPADAPWVGWDARQEAARRARWLAGRARGQLGRFVRVDECGQQTIVASCACGHERLAPAACSCGRLCTRCRSHAATGRQVRFAQARAVIVQRARRIGLDKQKRGRKRYGEKFLTLTVPHVLDPGQVEGDRHVAESRGEGEAEQAVATRVRLLLGAWRVFTLRLRQWARRAGIGKKQNGTGIPYYRAFEWTPGSDGRGHPHFHVWLYAPFIPRESIERWWRAAIESVGYAFGNDETLIFDVRSVRSPSTFSGELIKGSGHELRIASAGGDVVVRYAEGWQLNEYAGDGRCSADVLARLYECMDGKRLTCTSRGLLLFEPALCPACGDCGTCTVRIDRRSRDELSSEKTGSPRAPP